MKTNLPAVAVALVLTSGVVPAPAQASEPHRIGAISVTSEGRPRLTLEGTAPTAFKSYFDLFHLESSVDLARWDSLATVVRTNADTKAPTFLDATAADSSLRFYRTASNHVLTPFLAPTGPHAVGTFSRMLTDPSRTNRFRVKTNSSFMVTFWYPAQAPTGNLAPYMDRLLAERRAYWGTYTNAVPALVQFASVEAPVATEAGPFPVILYSHGLGDQQGRAVRTENTGKAVELASHGYVVVALDHTDTYATVLPPDRLIVGGNVWSFDFLPDRLKDVSFLLDRIVQWNTEDPFFQGRLDLDRLGIMGWSWGGGTSAEACRIEDRLKAAVLLDAYFGSVPTLLKSGLGKPFLTMMAPGGSGDNATLFSKSAKDAYQLSIKDASHEAFTDNAWTVGPSAASRRRAQAMNACLVSFLNKHLKGLADQLIENPAATLADVISFRKK